jgi:hypothetical protein
LLTDAKGIPFSVCVMEPIVTIKSL